MAEAGGPLGLLRGGLRDIGKTGYDALSDEALLGLIFTEGDRLPMEFVREAISRGERLVPVLAVAALDPHNYERVDAGWCSAIHACFILGAIGGAKAAEALLKAFDLSEETDDDWLVDEWASMFGRLGPVILEPLKERASEDMADCYWRHRAMSGMAAVTLAHPERTEEVFSFIAGIAADTDENPNARIWAGDILLDFRLKEHEHLLLSLAELPGDSVYDADGVREALSKKDPALRWYKRDWLKFYTAEEVAGRLKSSASGRLSEDDAWEQAMEHLEEEMEGLGPLSWDEAEKMLGSLLPLAKKAEEAMCFEAEDPSREDSLRRYSVAMELYEAISRDRSKFRLFDAYLDDLLGWLVSLPIELASQGLVDEAARLGSAWSELKEPENFLSDLAVILAEAARETEAREQIRKNLKRFPEEIWVRIKAGDAFRALKDYPCAEAEYRKGLGLAEDSEDRSAVLERFIPVLRENDKSAEADGLEAEEDRCKDEERRRAEEARARWTTVVRQGPKIGRNDPCPCGSGKKHKKCCLGKESPPRPTTPAGA